MHLTADRIADYLAGFLDNNDTREVEEHLFACSTCVAAAAPLAGLASAIRTTLPPVLTADQLAELQGEGRIEQLNVMSPGQTAQVRYPIRGMLLVHRLGGSDLKDARRVDLEVADLDGKLLDLFEDVPFDSAHGEVLVACQSHFADLYPSDALFRVQIIQGEERHEAGRYTVLHRV